MAKRSSLLEIERIEETRLTAPVEAEIAALLNHAFNTDFGAFSYYQQRHHVRLIARRDGAIIGHMALGYRTVRLGETLLNIAALAEVATEPALQGQGIASALMTATLAEARAMNADFMVLFGDENLYAGTGFLAKTNPLTWLALEDHRTAKIFEGHHDKLMVLQLGDIPWDDAAPLDLLGHKF